MPDFLEIKALIQIETDALKMKNRRSEENHKGMFFSFSPHFQVWSMRKHKEVAHEMLNAFGRITENSDCEGGQKAVTLQHHQRQKFTARKGLKIIAIGMASLPLNS